MKTAAGFFWKSAWAFMLGYGVSGMIQAFVPRARLSRLMGGGGPKSVALATGFGAISSSCSFAALATARSLLVKGAHFIAAVAFMFASTNLVIELGILILVFLGWQFLAAEVVGGLVLIAVSSLLIRLTYPRSWLAAARKRAEETAPEEEEDFDWRRRLRSARGWRLAGHRFVGEWEMAWEDVLIGFTVAGFVAVLVPDAFWKALFLADAQGLPEWLVVLENAAVAPFVAAMTFIGSMGNIPLATVLNASGVLFAGIMGFIYSDLMVPPLVRMNARYYGWRVALYIAGVMLVSILVTALALHWSFSLLGIVPEGPGRRVGEIARFGLDYTFWLNVVFLAATGLLVWLHRRYLAAEGGSGTHGGGHGSGAGIKRWVVRFFLAVLAGGGVAYLVTGGAG